MFLQAAKVDVGVVARETRSETVSIPRHHRRVSLPSEHLWISLDLAAIFSDLLTPGCVYLARRFVRSDSLAATSLLSFFLPLLASCLVSDNLCYLSFFVLLPPTPTCLVRRSTRLASTFFHETSSFVVFLPFCPRFSGTSVVSSRGIVHDLQELAFHRESEPRWPVGVAKVHVDSDRLDETESRRRCRGTTASCREGRRCWFATIGWMNSFLGESSPWRPGSLDKPMEFSVIDSICNSTRREVDSLFIFDFAAPMEIVFSSLFTAHYVISLASCGNLANRFAVTHPGWENRCGDFIVSMICRESKS